MLKIPAEYHISFAKFMDISCKLPASLLGVPVGVCQTALLDKSGIVRTQIGTHNRSENGRSAQDALYDTIPLL
jgi:hypothetical protein